MVRGQVRMLMRGHLRVMVEQHRITRCGLRRREIMVVPPEQEIASRVTGMRVQMPHVPVVSLEVVVLRARAYFRSSHRRSRILMGRRYPSTTSVVPRTHLQPVGRQVVMPTIHKRVNHFLLQTVPALGPKTNI